MHFSSNVVRFRLTDSMSLSSCSVTIEMQFADSRHGDFSTKKKRRLTIDSVIMTKIIVTIKESENGFVRKFRIILKNLV